MVTTSFRYEGREIVCHCFVQCCGEGKCLTLFYLCGEQSGQVDLRDHLAAAIALTLVRVVVVFDQVPQLGATL